MFQAKASSDILIDLSNAKTSSRVCGFLIDHITAQERKGMKKVLPNNLKSS